MYTTVKHAADYKWIQKKCRWFHPCPISWPRMVFRLRSFIIGMLVYLCMNYMMWMDRKEESHLIHIARLDTNAKSEAQNMVRLDRNDEFHTSHMVRLDRNVESHTPHMVRLDRNDELHTPHMVRLDRNVESHTSHMVGMDRNQSNISHMVRLNRTDESQTLHMVGMDRNQSRTSHIIRLDRNESRISHIYSPTSHIIRLDRREQSHKPQTEEYNMYSCMDGSDCQRLQKIWKSWPNSKPRGVIYFLTRTREFEVKLKISLHQLHEFFNKKFNYPIVIFHEEDFKHLIPTVRKLTTSTIFFHKVQFQIPEFLGNISKHARMCQFPIGYNHMCRFHSKLVFEMSIFENVDFIWRQDDDSFITKPIKYDIFSYMQERDLYYGHLKVYMDSPDCVINLWASVKEYIKSKNIKPTYFYSWREPFIIYNNFEIYKIAFWKGKHYQDFINYIDQLGGIYYYRWGDAPIKTLALSLFVQKSKVYQFHDIGYKHQNIIIY